MSVATTSWKYEPFDSCVWKRSVTACLAPCDRAATTPVVATRAATATATRTAARTRTSDLTGLRGLCPDAL